MYDFGLCTDPDNATLESYEKNLVDWYSSCLISIQEHLKRISNTVICDAFFSKATFIKPLYDNGFHVISRFRNDAVLFYPTWKKTGQENADVPNYMTERLTLKIWTSQDVPSTKWTQVNFTDWKHTPKHSNALWAWLYGILWMEDRKWQLYFFTDENRRTGCSGAL